MTKTTTMKKYWKNPQENDLKKQAGIIILKCSKINFPQKKVFCKMMKDTKYTKNEKEIHQVKLSFWASLTKLMCTDNCRRNITKV